MIVIGAGDGTSLILYDYNKNYNAVLTAGTSADLFWHYVDESADAARFLGNIPIGENVVVPLATEVDRAITIRAVTRSIYSNASNPLDIRNATQVSGTSTRIDAIPIIYVARPVTYKQAVIGIDNWSRFARVRKIETAWTEEALLAQVPGSGGYALRILDLDQGWDDTAETNSVESNELPDFVFISRDYTDPSAPAFSHGTRFVRIAHSFESTDRATGATYLDKVNSLLFTDWSEVLEFDFATSAVTNAGGTAPAAEYSIGIPDAWPVNTLDGDGLLEVKGAEQVTATEFVPGVMNAGPTDQYIGGRKFYRQQQVFGSWAESSNNKWRPPLASDWPTGPAAVAFNAPLAAYGLGDGTNAAPGRLHFYNAFATVGAGITPEAVAADDILGRIAPAGWVGASGFRFSGRIDFVAEDDPDVTNLPVSVDIYGGKAHQATDNTGTRGLRIDSVGNAVLGVGGLAADAAAGFAWIPTLAGTPTGTPAPTHTGYTPVGFYNGAIYGWNGAAWVTAGGGSPAGSGTELQYRNGSAFGPVTGSSVTGANIGLTGEVYTTGNFKVQRTTTSTTPNGGLLVLQTMTNASYADPTAWHYGIGLQQTVNTTAAAGKSAGVYSLLEMAAVPTTSHTGAAIVAGLYVPTALTFGSGRALHGIYVDDILGSATSIHTYYGVRVLEPTGTVINKFGVVVEGAQKSGFGISGTPSSLVHIGAGDGSTYDPPSGILTPTCLYIADGTSGTPSTSASPMVTLVRRWNATAVAGGAGALHIDLTNDKTGQATLETVSVRSRNNGTINGDYIGIASRMVVEGAPGTNTSMFGMWSLTQKMTRVDAGGAEYAFDNQYSRTISAATNASPIEITVTFPHYLTTGDEVYIADVGGNTAANGTLWTVTVVNSTKFTLDGSTGNAPYTSGGTVYLHNARDYGTAGNRGYAASYFLGAGNSYGNATAILVIGSGDPTRTQAYTGFDIRPDSISPLTHRAIRMPNADYLSSWNADESATYHLIGLAVGNTVSLDPDGRTIYAGTGPTQITNANGTLRAAALDSAIGTPAGSGSELQFRNAGAFGAVTGSSVSGAAIGLAGQLSTTADISISRTTTSTSPSGALYILNTQSNASYASPSSWYFGSGIQHSVNSTAASGKATASYALLEVPVVPTSTHTGAAIVAGLYFSSGSTFGSNRNYHGIYVDDILGSPTSINTYYGIRIIEPTVTVVNKFGIVVEGAQKSGFGTSTPLDTVHIVGENLQANAVGGSISSAWYGFGTAPVLLLHRTLGAEGTPSGYPLTNGARLGQIRFSGSFDTTAIPARPISNTAPVNMIGAIIQVDASGTWDATNNPADLIVRTGALVGVSRANALIVTSDRRTVVGDAVVHADASYAFNVKGDAWHFSDTLTQLIVHSAGDQPSHLSLVSSAGTYGSPTASAASKISYLKYNVYNSSNALKEVATIAGGLAGANGTNPDGTLIFYLRSGVVMQSFMSLTPSLLTVSPAATFQSTISSTGEMYTTANFRAVRTTSSTTPSGGILIQQTNTNTSYADGSVWHYAIGLEQVVNNTAASGKVAGVYSLLEYSQVPATAHTGAAIVAGVYFTTALTIGSNKPLHGIYVDDILGSYTSINTYYGIRVIEPTGTVSNKYGIVVEGSQLSGFGTTPSATVHVSGTFRIDLGSDATADMWYRASTGNSARIATSGKVAGNVLTLYDSGGGVLLPRWDTASGGGANTALSNLASVSINLSLIPQTTLDLGATTTAWRNLYIYGAGTFGSHSLKFHGTPTGHRTITFPDATATVATLAEVETLTNKTLGADTVFNISTTAAQTHTFTQSTADAVGVVMKFQKTRAGVVSGGDVVTDLLFQGYGGSAYYDAARIRVSIDAAAGNSDMPGFMLFSTTPNGSGTLAQAMFINSNQRVAVGPSIASGDVTSLLHIQDTTSSGRVFIAQATTGTSGAIIEAISGNVGTSYSTVFAIDRERSYALQSGNGGYLKHQYATATVNASNGASSIATSGLVPAGAVVLSVGAYVTTTFGNGNGLTTMKLGDGTTTNLYANAMARTSGTNIGLAEHLSGTFGPKFYASGMDVTITANAGTFTAVGTIRIEVWYYLSDGPLQ